MLSQRAADRAAECWKASPDLTGKPVVSPHISYVSSRGVPNPFVARNVKLATAAVLIHVEDRKLNNDAAMEGFGTPQQKRMKYAG